VFHRELIILASIFGCTFATGVPPAVSAEVTLRLPHEQLAAVGASLLHWVCPQVPQASELVYSPYYIIAARGLQRGERVYTWAMLCTGIAQSTAPGKSFNRRDVGHDVFRCLVAVRVIESTPESLLQLCGPLPLSAKDWEISPSKPPTSPRSSRSSRTTAPASRPPGTFDIIGPPGPIHPFPSPESGPLVEPDDASPPPRVNGGPSYPLPYPDKTHSPHPTRNRSRGPRSRGSLPLLPTNPAQSKPERGKRPPPSLFVRPGAKGGLSPASSIPPPPSNSSNDFTAGTLAATFESNLAETQRPLPPA
jgi:hypothetical protein